MSNKVLVLIGNFKCRVSMRLAELWSNIKEQINQIYPDLAIVSIYNSETYKGISYPLILLLSVEDFNDNNLEKAIFMEAGKYNRFDAQEYLKFLNKNWLEIN